ncbi:AraC family transcriptional regulator [Chitinophaga sp. MM2321]|uniref:helix-turn-helix transcriptional regulator n=1 Tax=Chitinophaga sp. MM2321 TaxID=3137178 RepID=UPI0032D58BCA
MGANNAVYREKGEIYHSDTCEPLLDAWRFGEIQLEAWARLSYPGYRMNTGVLSGINTIGYWDAQRTQEWGLDWHRNEGIEITFLETGTSAFAMEDSTHTMTPDEFTITRPWQLHKVGNPFVGVGRLHWLILDVGVRHPHQEWKWPSWILLNKTDIEELSKMLRQNEQPVWKANADIRRCFQKIGQLIKHDRAAGNESWVAIYVNELLLHILNLFRQGTFSFNEALTNSSRTVELFIKELQESFHEPWTLESMAEHCGLGVTRFVHYFRQIANSTPMQYLNYVRVTAAAVQLIEHPATNISGIGYSCGFSSSQYFSTVFRKQFGCSPATYRTTKLSGLRHIKAAAPENPPVS